MRVLVSVLGKPPEKYQEVEWIIPASLKTSVRARMPAQALAHFLGVDHVLVLVPDSLVNNSSAPTSPTTYADFQRRARDLLPPDLGSRFGGQWHSIVLPSRYSSQVLGDVRDFYRAAMFFLARWFAGHLDNPDTPVELYLETSTGLNILQVFTYSAVHELANALAFFRNVTLKVYNADPVTRQTTEAHIFLTEERDPLRPSFARAHLPSTPRLAESTRPDRHPGRDPTYRELRKTLTDLWPGNDLGAFLNSIYYGIPLGIVQWFAEHPAQLFEALECLYHYVLDNADWDTEHKLFRRPVSLGPDVALYALGSLISHQLQQRWPFFTPALKQKGITYNQLRDIMEKMYQHHPVILNRFQDERTIQPDFLQCPSSPTLLAQCLPNGRPCTDSNVNRRHFFAHVGFEQCAVQVYCQDNEFFFRLAPKTLKTVQKFLANP